VTGVLIRRPSLRVAIVGAGPAGLCAANELLTRNTTVRVELFERLPVPGGLARFGVAPDHAARRPVVDFYLRQAVASGRFRLHANVEVGRHVERVELLKYCHAVIHASGAADDRRLAIPGESLPGCHAASEFVAWYNGHPDFADRQFDLGTERAIVVGNGNVALDLARMLLLPAAQLAATDVAGPALRALEASAVREVVILGRRGPAQAAFTLPELVELTTLDDVDVIVEGPPELLADPGRCAHPLRMRLLRELAARGVTGRRRRLVLRFLASPTEILGTERARGVRVARNRLVTEANGTLRAETTGTVDELSGGLVLRAVGYRAHPIAGLPFDEATGTVTNREGRVLEPDSGAALPGTYVTGWLKRGPSGVIGSNKPCARQTVAALLADADAGQLPPPVGPPDSFDDWLAARRPERVDYVAWRRIARAERAQRA
jgi:ferredoxin--NADP+ reductase